MVAKYKTIAKRGSDARKAKIQALKCYGAYRHRDKEISTDRKSSMYRVYNDILKNVYGD